MGSWLPTGDRPWWINHLSQVATTGRSFRIEEIDYHQIVRVILWKTTTSRRMPEFMTESNSSSNQIWWLSGNLNFFTKLIEWMDTDKGSRYCGTPWLSIPWIRSYPLNLKENLPSQVLRMGLLHKIKHIYTFDVFNQIRNSQGKNLGFMSPVDPMVALLSLLRSYIICAVCIKIHGSYLCMCVHEPQFLFILCYQLRGKSTPCLWQHFPHDGWCFLTLVGDSSQQSCHISGSILFLGNPNWGYSPSKRPKWLIHGGY